MFCVGDATAQSNKKFNLHRFDIGGYVCRLSEKNDNTGLREKVVTMSLSGRVRVTRWLRVSGDATWVQINGYLPQPDNPYRMYGLAGEFMILNHKDVNLAAKLGTAYGNLSYTWDQVDPKSWQWKYQYGAVIDVRVKGPFWITGGAQYYKNDLSEVSGDLAIFILSIGGRVAF